MSESKKYLRLVEVSVYRRYAVEHDDKHHLVVDNNWYCDFEYDTAVESAVEGLSWEKLLQPAMPQLIKWIEQREPQHDNWISFHFFTLWELYFHKSYCWEYGTYEYDSEAYCLGLVDEKLWTPEGLGLVDKVDYDKETSQ